MRKKKIKVYAVIDSGFPVSDGTEQLAIFWSKRPAQEWHKEMFHKGGGKVVPVEIKLLSPNKTK